MTTNAESILVMAGTGKTGRRLVPTLRAAGHHARAASRSGEVRFDWSRQDTWEPALAGASAVYLLAPEEPTLAADFVTRAADSGVRRIVALSGRGIDQVGDFSPGMVAAETAVRTSGVQWSIIRANNFSQNFSEDLWRQPLLDGRLALPIGVTPESPSSTPRTSPRWPRRS
ncbi:NAD(P)H-binding protein [Micromonospora sp. WMMD1155]|uniref:SDR family oxidoreductase n=1 Tax=Micromonospora sp. WMMD1155 TaxID=3016094 RepID=UPI00249C3214|nr:NAD(P)H-binding protein [Micromonospora sp. WMMD1155]WFE53595.1 NAD(P)H-binding protein [Micromonospora sp. WMMD1155]